MNEEHYRKVIEYSNAMTAWLRGEGEKPVALDLTSADLYRADLAGINLTDANLTRADLTRANLTRADLYRADLAGINLTDANLTDADLTRANLCRADLAGASLAHANLIYTNLTDANLTGANLSNANLDDVAMNWESHALIGERLRQAAGDDYSRLALAGAIVNNPEKCWGYWLNHTPLDLREWALSVMRTWVKDANNAPDILKEVSK